MREPLVEPDPGPERRRWAALERLGEADGVLALDPEARMEDPLGPVAVVGEQDQPLGVAVEPADRVEPAGAAPERGGTRSRTVRVGVPVARRST